MKCLRGVILLLIVSALLGCSSDAPKKGHLAYELRISEKYSMDRTSVRLSFTPGKSQPGRSMVTGTPVFGDDIIICVYRDNEGSDKKASKEIVDYIISETVDLGITEYKLTVKNSSGDVIFLKDQTHAPTNSD